MTTIGTVESLWRYPVKSMSGEAMTEAFMGFSGFYGDRCFAFKNSSAPKGFPYLNANVQQQMLVQQTRPPYPPLAKQARIQGVVRLNAIIGRDGTVVNLSVATGHPLLVPAALEAVKQWVYKPYRDQGKPVPFCTAVTFIYSQR